VLEIEIFSDVVCPWCFIGKHRLDSVLASGVGEGVHLRWRPYQLYPNIDPGGVDRGESLRRRFGADADAGRIPERIDQEATSEGIHLRFDRIKRTPNTLTAHRLMELAYAHGVQHELAEVLFNGYFCNGRDVGDIEQLVELAGEVGLSAEATREFLHSDEALDEVQTQLARAPDIGISGVPGYYLANSFLIPGAQSTETMAQIIARVKSKLAARASQNDQAPDN